LDKAEEPEELSAFFTAIGLYSMEVWVDLLGERKLEDLIVFEDFGRNGDGIERVRKALLKNFKGLFVHVVFDEDVREFEIGFGVFGVDSDGFFIDLNRVFMQVLVNFGFGPVQVNVVEVWKFFKAFHNVAFDGLEFVVGIALHEGGNQPKVQFLLLVFFLDVRNYLLQVNAGLAVLLLFQKLLYLLVFCYYHVLLHVHCLMLFIWQVVWRRVASCMLNKFTFSAIVRRQRESLSFLFYGLLRGVNLDSVLDGFGRGVAVCQFYIFIIAGLILTFRTEEE
jgi:hypothetical protein